MAATTIKPYPHVQINVKDNSIATIDFVETLPVHRPLYVMRTKKGPLGEPTWCNTYSEAAALFGAETFDPANKEYFSLPSLYLRDTLTRNGAFITRYLPTQYGKDGKAITKNPGEYAVSVLWAIVNKRTDDASLQLKGIIQYEKDAEGYTSTVWSDTYQEFVKKPVYKGSNPPSDPAKATESQLFREDGIQIEFIYTQPSASELEELLSNPKITKLSATSIKVPIAVFKAKDPGKYGNDLAYKLFYTDKNNNAGDVEAYKTVFYNIGFAEREDSNSTWDAITDIYTRESTPFAANPNTINPDTGASMSIDYVLDKGFSDKAHQLPVDFALFEENLNTIGLIIASFENDEMDSQGNIGTKEGKVPTSDIAPVAGKVYYTLNNGQYTEFTGNAFAEGTTYYVNTVTSASINVGGAVLGALTADEKKNIQDYYFNGSSIGAPVKTVDTKPVSGKTYYTIDGGAYVETAPKVVTSDTAPVAGTTYYTLDGSEYTKFTGSTFAEGITYYVDGFASDVNYYEYPTKPTSELGYMINAISGKNLINESYDHVVVVKDAEKKALYDRDGYVYGFEYTNVDTDAAVTEDGLYVTEPIMVETTDSTPQSGVTYYYLDSVTGFYKEFTGDTFTAGTTYYIDSNPGSRRISGTYKPNPILINKVINANLGANAGLVSLTDFYNIALTGGSDGIYYEPIRTGTGMFTPQAIEDSVVTTNEIQSSDDKAMYDFVKLKLPVIKDRIVESLRFPFTHIFDVGYTMKTKKAICDFLDVRDDFVFIASPQVLYSDGTKRSVTQNDMAKDEANTEALRAYALLMRESVLYGTDCMRVSIYEHSGHLVNSVYQGVVPHTFWAAVQYSQYGNLTYMSKTEPRGLPYSYNLLFKDQNWTNYRADSQSRVWDEGGNYVQFADMTRLFYPALRTVYRAATSVLIDEWVVASVVYTKYVARRAWARFSGRNDYAAALQDAIKKYIESELNLLFNGKYGFTVSVYQTAEERELGYIQHVKISITYGATMRVLDVDIEVNREGFVPEE